MAFKGLKLLFLYYLFVHPDCYFVCLDTWLVCWASMFGLKEKSLLPFCLDLYESFCLSMFHTLKRYVQGIDVKV